KDKRQPHRLYYSEPSPWVPAFAGMTHMALFALHPAAEGVKQGLRIAIGLGGALEDQGTRGLESEARLLVAGHGLVERVAFILRIDPGSHPPERRLHLVCGADAVQQPVG